MRKEFEENEESENKSENNLETQDEIDDETFQKILEKEFIEREKRITAALFEELVPDVDAIRRKETASDEKRVISIEEIRDRRKKAAEREMREEVSKEANTEEPNAKNRTNTKIRTTGGGLHRLGKVVGMAVVCVACVFAASMTSEANRKYLVNSVRIWSGDDTKTVDDNDENNERANVDEATAIENIEERLGVKVPEFYYRPYDFCFSDYSIREFSLLARIEYSYKDSYLTLYIDRQEEHTASKTNSMHGDEENILTLDNDGVQISVREVYAESKEIPSYLAEWEKNNTIYSLSGKIELEEIKKILENMEI